jgi:hypothetical protein
MPGKPFQSKLEPFYSFIRECRLKRWSYARIATAITRDHGMSVSANAVFSFVKVRAKGRKLYTLPDPTGLGPSRREQHSDAPASRDLERLADSFFASTDEAQKPAHQKAHNEKRPYRLDF